MDGPATACVEINAQSEHDLMVTEALAIPFSFLVLVGVFGGLLAAAVPLAVGVWAIVGSMALLRVLTLFTEVSTFALNLTIAMGLALAVDYTLLNDEAIAMGLSRTGRIVTAAALLMGISFAALMASQVSLMVMFGLGLTLAVLMDATLVRMLMVPAFLHLLGRRNWWAPARMARWHERFGIREVAPARRVARTGGGHRARPFPAERGLPSRS